MNIVLCAGEASGDAYGATLIQEIQRQYPEQEFVFSAIGGARLAQAGARLLDHSGRWGAIGIYESLKVVPRVMAGVRRIRKVLEQQKPGIFIPIDFGYVNVKLSRVARARGWKVLYFSPPGGWRRDKQGADLPAVTDRIICIFSWSAEILQQQGADARFYGHPLRQLITEAGEFPRAPDVLAILPGSREHEIARNLPPFAHAAAALGARPVIAALPDADPHDMLHIWQSAGGSRDVEVVCGQTYAVLKRARAALVCSGTATLEAALCGTPAVIAYRGSKVMEWEYRLRRPSFRFIGMPNILLDEPLIPELIQWDATPERILSEMGAVWPDGEARLQQLAGFARLESLLGSEAAITAAVAELEDWISR